MPFDYTDPFTRAAMSMRTQPAAPQRPLLPGEPDAPPARRSLFDDPSIRERLARADFGQVRPGGPAPMTGLPDGMTPLAGPSLTEPASAPPPQYFGNIVGASPLTEPDLAGYHAQVQSAMGEPSKAAPPISGVGDPKALMGQIATSSAAPMKFQVGGAEPFQANAQRAFDPQMGEDAAANQKRLAEQWGMTGSPLVPASQLGGFRGMDVGTTGKTYGGDLTPGKYSDTLAPASANPIQDQLMAMLNQPAPNAVSSYGPGGRPDFNPNYQAEALAHSQKMATLNELMKSQNQTDFQKQQLQIDRDKLALAEKAQNYTMSPEKQREAELEKLQMGWTAQNMSAVDQAIAVGKIKKQWAAQDALRGSKTPPSALTPAPGGQAPPPAAVQKPSGPKGIEEQIASIPESILSQLNDPKAQKDAQGQSSPRGIEDFLTQLHLLEKSQPGTITPELAPALKSLIQEKYGLDALNKATDPDGMKQLMTGLRMAGNAPWQTNKFMMSQMPGTSLLMKGANALGFMKDTSPPGLHPQDQATRYFKQYFANPSQVAGPTAPSGVSLDLIKKYDEMMRQRGGAVPQRNPDGTVKQ